MAFADALAGAALTDEWEALAEALDAPPFLRPGWFDAWSLAFGSARLEPVVVRDGGQLAALMPVEAGRRIARAPANWHSPCYAPLAASPDARDELLRELFARPEPAIELGLLDDGDTNSVIEPAARDQDRLVASRIVARAPFVELEDDFAVYERRLSRNRRRALRRQRRRLEELGTVGFEVHDGGESLDALLGELLAVEASGWKGARGTAIASRSETRGFYTGVARWAADGGWLRLAFLRLDGKPIAVDYALEHGGTWYSLKAGYDERFARFGPGALLLRDEIAHCCRAGLTRLDLLGNEDPFKLSWTSCRAPRRWVGAYRRSPSGVARWAAASTLIEARRRYGSIKPRRIA